MKKYKIQIIQITIMTFLVVVYSIAIPYVMNSFSENIYEEGEIILKYSNHPETFVSTKKSESTLYYTDEDLLLEQKVEVETAVLGNVIDDSKNKTYYNNFDDIIVVGKHDSITYEVNLDSRILNTIYDNQVIINNVHSEDDYYHSVASVQLESTINYTVSASIVTQIKDNKRHDILVYEDVHAISYDKENDEFYLFYSSSNSQEALHIYNDLIVSKLIWDEKEETYVQDDSSKNQSIKLSSQGILHIDPIISDDTKIVYTREVGLSDRQIFSYWIATFNTETLEIKGSLSVSTKEVFNDKNLRIINTLTSEQFVYVFFSDLTYYKIDKNTYQKDEYIISNTGKIEDLAFDIYDDQIYMYYTNDKVNSYAKLNDGVLSDKVTKTKRDMNMGFFDFDTIVDFNINLDE